MSKINYKKILTLAGLVLVSGSFVGCSNEETEEMVQVDANMEITPENVKNVLLENGFDIKDVDLTYDDKLSISLQSEPSKSVLYSKGYDVVNFLETNFKIDNGYWISGFSDETFIGSFRLERADIIADMSLSDMKSIAHSQNGVLE